MPQKYCRKFEPPEQGARTLQTTDRRGRAIAYSRSLIKRCQHSHSISPTLLAILALHVRAYFRSTPISDQIISYSVLCCIHPYFTVAISGGLQQQQQQLRWATVRPRQTWAENGVGAVVPLSVGGCGLGRGLLPYFYILVLSRFAPRTSTLSLTRT